jgi:hypothetical protein
MHALQGLRQIYIFTWTISPILEKGYKSYCYDPDIMTVDNHSVEAGKKNA